MAEKPNGVVIVTVLLGYMGLTWSVYGLTFIGSVTYAGPISLGTMLQLLFGLGALNLIGSYGIWNLKSWARTMGIILAVIDMTLGVVGSTGAKEILVGIGILYFLLIHKETKQIFEDIKNRQGTQV